MEARVSVLERTVTQHDKRISKLEQQQAVSEATVTAMQEDIREAKAAAQHAANGVDSLKMWLLALVAGAALNLLYMILGG